MNVEDGPPEGAEVGALGAEGGMGGEEDYEFYADGPGSWWEYRPLPLAGDREPADRGDGDVVFGPYPAAQMVHWAKEGYFAPSSMNGGAEVPEPVPCVAHAGDSRGEHRDRKWNLGLNPSSLRAGAAGVRRWRREARRLGASARAFPRCAGGAFCGQGWQRCACPSCREGTTEARGTTEVRGGQHWTVDIGQSR